jgi:hypothetical protein
MISLGFKVNLLHMSEHELFTFLFLHFINRIKKTLLFLVNRNESYISENN